MAQMILGIFSNHADAQGAIDDLTARGYSAKDISIVVKEGVVSATHDVDDANRTAQGAVSGATTGGIVGALAGLLVGVGAIAIPGFGAILIGGPIAAALGLTGAAATTVSGAVTGALAGGLVGALTNLGVPEQRAQEYERQIQSGAILLAVPVNPDQVETVRGIMQNHAATQMDTVNANA